MKSIKKFYILFLILIITVSLVACTTTPETEKVTVKFESSGGSPVSSVVIDKNGTLSRPQDPTYGDNLFGGWFKDPEFKDRFSFDSEIVTEDITLYAYWSMVAPCGIKGHYTDDGLDHRKADCGIDGHYNCDGNMHNSQGETGELPFYYGEDYPMDRNFTQGMQKWNPNVAENAGADTVIEVNKDKSVEGNNGSINIFGSGTEGESFAWIEKYIHVPGGDSQVSFTFMASSLDGSGINMRVSMEVDGASNIVKDYTSIEGAEWQQVIIDMNEYKDKNVRVRIEAGYNASFNGGESLFVDNMAIVVDDTLKTPFEYNDEHPMDSDFTIDSQGWEGDYSTDCDGSVAVTTHVADISHSGGANGSLVLRAGSVTGDTVNPLTWWTKYVVVPEVEGEDTLFEMYVRSIGLNNANVRLSIIDADGAYKTVTDWKRIAGDNWVNVSINLNEYRGTNIFIVIEQGFDGEKSNEEILFIDDLRVYTQDPTEVEQPYEYNDEHPMDSDFVMDSQGWKGEFTEDCDASVAVTTHTADISHSGGANGSLVLRAGSLSGNTTDPLTWWKKYVVVPDVEGLDTVFELYTRSIGANNANIRLSIIDADGLYKTVTDWRKISGDEWINIPINLNAYKGTNIYILIEQGFDGEKSNEEILFIDDLRVFTEEHKEEEIPFEYNETHPMDGNFSVDTQGWKGGQSEDCDGSVAVTTHPTDISYSGGANGSLVLRAGSVSGDTVNPLTWFSKYVVVPEVQGEDTFFELYARSIGANNANIRISIKDANGQYVVMTNWEKISGDTWINISANLNDYRGTNVYVLVEQGFDGEVSGEEILFIDDLRVYTKAASTEEVPFEYNEEHPMDSDFLANAQGWEGGQSADCDGSVAVTTHTADISHTGGANGSLVLRAGSLTDNTTDPLTWFSKYVAVPSVDGEDAFFELYTRSIGGNNANIRISIKDDEGNTKTLTEWQKISGDEWINIKVNLNDYKGKNVHIILEQGFDGEKSYEEILFMDDLRVFTASAA